MRKLKEVQAHQFILRMTPFGHRQSYSASRSNVHLSRKYIAINVSVFPFFLQAFLFNYMIII